MRDRVFGIETEYAVIYHPARGERVRPTNLELYAHFEAALARRVHGLPRAFSLLRAKQGRFLENGATFHYEATPAAFEQGLIEMASPECRDPFTLLRYERAKDLLIEGLALEVNGRLRRLGLAGEVRIGKNNVDSQGHTFGSHESYWVEDRLSRGERLRLLPLWAGAWLLTAPVFAWLAAVTAAVIAAGLALLLLPVLGALGAGLAALVRRPAPRLAEAIAGHSARCASLPARLAERLRADPGALPRALAWVEAPLRPAVALHSALHNRFHFRRFRQHLTAFLVTRTVFAGAGAVAFDASPLFRLAQRPPFLRVLARIFTSGDVRPLYESRDVFFRPWSVLSSRRRLHLLVGDANLCDFAQVLRVGATALVLEAIEAGALEPWPVLADPLGALRALNRDTGLARPLALEGGATATPLEIQRRYLAGAGRVLLRGAGGALPPAPWKARVLAMWEETLALLERDPEALGDRLDWVAKRALVLREAPVAEDRAALEARGAALLAAPSESLDAGDRRLREIAYRVLRADLRYHELGPRGGHRQLVRRGAVRELVSSAQVMRALREPPADTRAHGRGLAIREACERALPGGATWHRVRIGLRTWRWFADPLRPGATWSLG
jgi:Pup amidohydrolase